MLTDKQASRIRALQVIGIPQREIMKRTSCTLEDLSDVCEEVEMTPDEALVVLLGPE